MSKSLRSMSEHESRLAISRRLASGSKGLGYWAAHDASEKAAQSVNELPKQAITKVLAGHAPQ